MDEKIEECCKDMLLHHAYRWQVLADVAGVLTSWTRPRNYMLLGRHIATSCICLHLVSSHATKSYSFTLAIHIYKQILNHEGGTRFVLVPHRPTPT